MTAARNLCTPQELPAAAPCQRQGTLSGRSERYRGSLLVAAMPLTLPQQMIGHSSAGCTGAYLGPSELRSHTLVLTGQVLTGGDAGARARRTAMLNVAGTRRLDVKRLWTPTSHPHQSCSREPVTVNGKVQLKHADLAGRASKPCTLQCGVVRGVARIVHQMQRTAEVCRRGERAPCRLLLFWAFLSTRQL